jgi:hypothetical protein
MTMHSAPEPIPTGDDIARLEREATDLLRHARSLKDAPPREAEAAWRAAYDAQAAARRARTLAMATWRKVEAARI